MRSGPRLRRGRDERRSERAQVLVLMALMMIVLCSAVGIGVDAGFGYIYSAGCERAAAAGALAGVVFMPNQFTPAQALPGGSRNDATDRAVDEAKKNGFDTTDVTNVVTVTVAAVAGKPNQLSVTVSRKVRTSFMAIFGVSSFTVSRTAIAASLPPLAVGQPGSQAGTTVSQLGGTGFYTMRALAYGADRADGDPFTTNPATEYFAPLAPAATDVHQISTSNSTEPADATLPTRGGYNFRVTLPAAGRIEVYNAAFAPGKTRDYCENYQTGKPGHTCSAGGNFYLHEDDRMNTSCPGACPAFGVNANFAAMRYTIYSVPNVNVRSTDVELTQMTVYPIDSSGWTASPPTYKDIKTAATITQTYNAVSGAPTNMMIYHSWIDVATYTEAGAGDLVVYNVAHPNYGGALPAGTYRLRVDTLEWNATVPNASGSAIAHKNYSVAATDAAGAACATCTAGAWEDAGLYTPVSGGTFSVPIVSIPPDYAGQTVTIEAFDLGDISSGAGTVTVSILDPSGAVATAAAPLTVNIYDVGTQVSNKPTNTACTLANPISNPPCLMYSGTTATATVTSGANTYLNGHWLLIQLPIPLSYSPGVNPANWYWKLQYATPAGTVAGDSFVMAVGFAGNPAHVVQS